MVCLFNSYHSGMHKFKIVTFVHIRLGVNETRD